jgi:hypothetical protein
MNPPPWGKIDGALTCMVFIRLSGEAQPGRAIG